MEVFISIAQNMVEWTMFGSVDVLFCVESGLCLAKWMTINLRGSARIECPLTNDIMTRIYYDIIFGRLTSKYHVTSH